MSEFSTGLQSEKRSLPLGYSFCSAIRKERAESELALPSDPEHKPLCKERNMPLILIKPENHLAQPLVEVEPPEWHAYRALVIYRNDHPVETDNDTYRAKMDAAHTSYINTFVGG